MRALVRCKPFFLTALLMCTCYMANAQIEFISEKNGTITVRTEGTDKKVPDAISGAEKLVFYSVFFQGIPGSSLKTGLIDIPEAEAEQKFKDYFDFFYKNRYFDFVTSVNQNGNVVKEKHHKKSIYFDVTINVNALRKDLEDNQVIRKFGF